MRRGEGGKRLKDEVIWLITSGSPPGEGPGVG